jgi:hypothetical protein
MKPLRAIQDSAHILMGISRYHLGRPKTIAVILSSMRSGSTLLKALLAEADDISQLPEIAFSQYRSMPAYKAYNLVCRLSEAPIIVLKRPVYYELTLPFPPGFIRLRIIILIRNALDVAASLIRMTEQDQERYAEPWTAEHAIAYWRDSYEKIISHPELTAHDTLFLKYEDLVTNPVEESLKAYRFLGSSRNSGTSHYRKPEHYEWSWGSDDGGDIIKSLQVDPSRKRASAPDQLLTNALRADSKACELMQRFGYSLPWEPQKT